MSLGTRQYSYSYTPPHLEEDSGQECQDDSALVINVRSVLLTLGLSISLPQVSHPLPWYLVL